MWMHEHTYFLSCGLRTFIFSHFLSVYSYFTFLSPLGHHTSFLPLSSPLPSSLPSFLSRGPLLSASLVSTYLHVSFQVQQMISVPGDKTRALVGEVDSSKAGLARPQVGFTDRVVVAPDEVVINGDVLELWGVPIWTEHLLMSEQGAHFVVELLNTHAQCTPVFLSLSKMVPLLHSLFDLKLIHTFMCSYL